MLPDDLRLQEQKRIAMSTHERADPSNGLRISRDVQLGRGAAIHCFVNLYGCRIGDESRVGAFVEIQKGAVIGARCKISSHTFICEGVTIEDEVFIGHGVMFINDLDPRATAGGRPQSEADWEVIPTRICKGASVGSGAVILAGVTVGPGALVGAGAVVTKDVGADQVVAGCPARVLRSRADIQANLERALCSTEE
jgi:acetyltransferase-like isoleucine patch superfamily enzyme